MGKIMHINVCIIIHSMYSISYCPDAAQILPKLPHYIKGSASLLLGVLMLYSTLIINYQN